MGLGVTNSCVGFISNTPSASTSTLAMSAAGTWFAMSFIGNGKTISTVSMYFSATNGTLVASDVTLDIFSTGTTGDPNASVSGPHNCGSAPSGAGWYSWSPNYATTDGVMYWCVLKNVNGTPGTNYPTARFVFAGGMPISIGGTQGSLWGWNKNHTTDSGTNWTQESRSVGGLFLSFNDSTYDGTPFSNNAVNANTIYSAREFGAKFTIPANVTLRVRAVVGGFVGNNGTPTNAMRARIYTGSSSTPTLLATSSGGPVAGQFGSNAVMYMPFASVQTISGGTTIRAVFGTTGSDTSSNAYRCVSSTVMNDANAKAVLPFGGWVSTYTTDGTTFTDTDTECPYVALILDNAAEWSASSGGLLRHPGMAGGLVA